MPLRGVGSISSVYRRRFPWSNTTTIKTNVNTYARYKLHFFYKVKERTFPKRRWDNVAQQVPQPHPNGEHTTNARSPATRRKAWLPSSDHVSAERPKRRGEGWVNAGQGKLCTHQSSGNGGWQRASLARAEGAPEAPRHGASSINPHGALWWSGHDITLQRENTQPCEHLGSPTSDSAG